MCVDFCTFSLVTFTNVVIVYIMFFGIEVTIISETDEKKLGKNHSQAILKKFIASWQGILPIINWDDFSSKIVKIMKRVKTNKINRFLHEV